MVKRPQTGTSKLLWDNFAQEEELSAEQVALFKRYYELLLEWNKIINLTTIITEKDIIAYHFKDSLRVADIINIQAISHCADVGTGGGFPGIPLAIKYPHIEITLIEVSEKKIQFLDAVITELSLGDRISVFDQDWRTFLRSTDEDIQLFCARASLQPEELLRMFKPSSPYKNASLIYFASEIWQPATRVEPFISKQIAYKIQDKKRRLILFKGIKG